MPSFDIVSRVEMQEIDNAVNNTRKQIANRYDFRGAKADVDLDRKARQIHLLTEDKMKLEAMRDILRANAVKRKVDLKTLKFKEAQPGAGSNLKQQVIIREGIDQETAKSIVKMIKDAKMKVQASIQGDEVRVSGKKIDDLQAVIQMVKEAKIDAPLQFINMQS